MGSLGELRLTAPDVMLDLHRCVLALSSPWKGRVRAAGCTECSGYASPSKTAPYGCA